MRGTKLKSIIITGYALPGVRLQHVFACVALDIVHMIDVDADPVLNIWMLVWSLYPLQSNPGCRKFEIRNLVRL